MDTQSSYNIELVNKITCRIDSPAGSGTGILIQTTCSEYLYLITAKHCLLGEKFNLDPNKQEIKIFVPDKQNLFETIQLEDCDIIHYDDDIQNDYAIIVLRKDHTRQILNSIPEVKLIDTNFTQLDCIFRGYPAPYNKVDSVKGINIGKVNYIDINVVTTITPLSTVVSDSHYNCKGFSGSGVFCLYDGEYYLSGIVYEIQEPFQRFPIYPISHFSNLIGENLQNLVFSKIPLLVEHKKHILLESLQEQFLKSQSSWLDQRYLSDLHGKGHIFNATEQLLGCKILRERIYNKLSKELDFIEDSLKELEYGLTVFSDTLLQDELNKVLRFLKTLKQNLLVVIESAQKGTQPGHLREYEPYNIYACVSILKSQPKKSISSINESDLKRVLNEIKEKGVDVFISKIHFTLLQKQLIFIGDPGTGKTHGLANAVQVQLQERNMPAIIIQARQYTDARNWKDILINVLGLSEQWSEEEIWSGLEACASQCDKSSENTQSEDGHVQNEETKVLICVDGIDEAIPWKNWINRIGELQVVLEKYSRIRVCISSRPYVFKEIRKYCYVQISGDGDIKVNELFDAYITYYNINIIEKETYSWIKWSLKTPFSLRLFCERYSNSNISNHIGIYTTISHLLSQKIKQIDSEVRERFGYKWGEQEELVKISLLRISQYFSKMDSSAKIERFQLSEMLKADKTIAMVEHLDLFKIIDYLVQYGLLYEIQENTDDPLFGEKKAYYQIQIQALMDYLLAAQTVREFNLDRNKGFPPILNDRYGAQQIYALSLLQDKYLLLGENGIWEDYEDEDLILDLQLFALSNASIDIAEHFIEWVKNNFKHSMPRCRKVVNQLIAKVSRIDKHPLGPQLAHEILMEYESVADRDKFWSVPEQLDYNNGAIWEGTGEFISSIEEFNLLAEDKFNGLPLLYAWQLTSVDNKVRKECRKQLAEWGVKNPDEFLRLLDITIESNDPQMKEDIFCCLFGISCKLEGDSVERTFAQWVIDNIFEEAKIKDIGNAVIRFAARAVVERAYFHELIDMKMLDLAKPPYAFNIEVIGLDEKAAKSVIGSRDGYTPIDSDLVWYVIKDGYTGFFDIDKDYDQEEENKLGVNLKISKEGLLFLKSHAQTIGERIITPNQFGIGFGINYIYKMGWCKDVFYGTPNGGKPGEILGVDVSIIRKYRQATHGSRSAIMSFAEKYTWCAVHEMLGYLADRLPYYYDTDQGKTKQIVDDYSLLLDIPNPIHELEEINFDKVRAETGWYIPNDLSPTLSCYNNETPEEIKGWLQYAPYPNLSKWLISEKDKMKSINSDLTGTWTCLSNYSRLSDPATKCESIMWIDSFLVNEQDFGLFVEDSGTNQALKECFSNSYSAHSSPNTDTYIDPASLCWMNWIQDSYSKFNISTQIGSQEVEYPIFKCLSEITSKCTDESEVTFILPSKMMRDLLSIQKGDGWRYLDIYNRLSVFYAITGRLYRESQSLLYANTDILKQALAENQLRMFWSVRILREPSLKTRDKYEGLNYFKDSTWLVFENGDVLNQVAVDNIDRF